MEGLSKILPIKSGEVDSAEVRIYSSISNGVWLDTIFIYPPSEGFQHVEIMVKKEGEEFKIAGFNLRSTAK